MTLRGEHEDRENLSASVLARCTRLVYTPRMAATINSMGDRIASAVGSMCSLTFLAVPSLPLNYSG
jgi:hypothetical protein